MSFTSSSKTNPLALIARVHALVAGLSLRASTRAIRARGIGPGDYDQEIRKSVSKLETRF